MAKRKRVQKSKSASGTIRRIKLAALKGPKPKARVNSKQAQVLALLKRPTGATIPTIMQVTGWQQHSVRGFLTAVVRKKLGLTLESEKGEGDRIYRIPADPAAKPQANTDTAKDETA